MAGRLHSVHKNLWKLFKISPKYFYRISHPYLHLDLTPKNSVSENDPFENNHLSKGKPPKTNDKGQIQTTNDKGQTTNDKGQIKTTNDKGQTTNDKRQTTMDPTRATTYPPTEEPMMDPAIILRTVLD